MFYLTYQAPKSPVKIHHEDSILLLGSCFSENIGKKLATYKFPVRINPFGTIYNPYSIFHLIENSLLNQQNVRPLENQGVFYDWNMHSRISAASERELHSTVQHVYQRESTLLAKTTWIIVSPGTAFIYRKKENDEIVANCHKVPAKAFRKELLTVDEILHQFEKLRASFEKQQVNVKWIFTVSPVRHIRDGLVENNRSKSILINALHQIVDRYEDCSYFPSYEIMIDQLRDYRFYAEDMVHPVPQAIDFIWEQFSASFFSRETQTINQEWSGILSALSHKPRNPDSQQHKKFLRETFSKIEGLANKLDVSKELESLTKQLKDESPQK